MDSEHWISRLAAAKRYYAAQLGHSAPEVVSAFLTTRCAGVTGAWGSMFGTMGPTLGKATADRIVERADVVG